MSHGICLSIMVDEDGDAEFAVVKMEFGNVYFRLLVVYGPQESDHIDKINQSYENLSLQIERASQTDQSSDVLQHSQNRPTGDRWLKF